MVTQQLCCSGLGEFKTIILNVCGLSVYFHSLYEVAQKHNMKNDMCYDFNKLCIPGSMSLHGTDSMMSHDSQISHEFIPVCNHL